VASGLEIRAQIDSEGVKGLLLVNGGGAVALMTFLGAIVSKPDLAPLVRAVVVGIVLCQVGLLLALVHNRLRRICSLIYEQYDYAPPPCNGGDWFDFKAPCACAASICCMWLSLVAFLASGITVASGAFDAITTTCAV
jgi:hypothetical protein